MNKIWGLHTLKCIQCEWEKTNYGCYNNFGSYAKAIDDTNSDIDICIISNKSKEINTKKYENQIERKISLHNFTKSSWKNTIKKNPWLANNICNGIVLAGQLEVMEWIFQKALKKDL